jgi:two-component system sensor histidine kinase TctE
LSLRAQLLLWLLVPLGAAAAVYAWAAYREAQTTAGRVQDRLLLGSARIIAQQVTFEDGVLDVAIPPAALELFQSQTPDQVYYRIASAQGLLLSGYAEVPPPPAPVLPEEFSFFRAVVRDQPVRVVAYAQPVFAAPAQSPVVIEMAQTLGGHDRMAEQIWATSLRQELGMMLLVALLLWIALRRGLKGLVRLSRHVQERNPGSLERLDPGPVPRELRPLIQAINGYVQRLDSQIAARNRFIANAAHQLRMPFTVLQTQTAFALKSSDPAQKDETLEAISQGVRGGTRLVNQLLSLSIAEARPQYVELRPALDLAALLQRVLEEHAGLAQARDMDLGLDLEPDLAQDLDQGAGPDGAEPPDRFTLNAPGAMVHELAANLVDNAIRYTQRGGVVTVALRREPEAVVLRVEDNGPGIPAADRTRAFERFSRLHPGATQGCGLGLAIVEEVARALGAAVELSDPAQGTGLVVTVRFPVGIPGSPTSG